MAQTTWTTDSPVLEKTQVNRTKYLVGGVVIIAALVFLAVNVMSGSAQFFVTVNEFHANPAKYVDRDLRVSALVIGDSIQFKQIDTYNSRLEFDITDDLNNPTQVLHMVAVNEPKPDLLQNEAQAVVEGSIGADGALYVNPGGLLLKCPTKYQELETASQP